MTRYVVAAALAVVALSGCSSSSTGAGPHHSAPTTASPPTVSPTPLPTTTASGTTANRVVVSLPWSYLGTSDGGRAVEIKTVISGCTHFVGVRVNQDSTKVEIAVVGIRPPSTARIACPAIARILTGSVHLEQPLGSRTLLHAPLSSTVS